MPGDRNALIPADRPAAGQGAGRGRVSGKLEDAAAHSAVVV